MKILYLNFMFKKLYIRIYERHFPSDFPMGTHTGHTPMVPKMEALEPPPPGQFKYRVWKRTEEQTDRETDRLLYLSGEWGR